MAHTLLRQSLQGGFGCGQYAGEVAAECLGDGGTIGLNDQFTQYACVFVLTSEHVQRCRPQVGVGAESVQNVAVKQLVIEPDGVADLALRDPADQAILQ